MYILTYETIDGSGEVEHEFSNLKAAYAFVDSMCGLLRWHSITDVYGNEVNFSLAKNVYARHTPLEQILLDGWYHGFHPSQALREASNAGYANCVAEPVRQALWKHIDDWYAAYQGYFTSTNDQLNPLV